MLSFFRRAPPPSIHEPAPTPAPLPTGAGQAKEPSWLASLSRRTTLRPREPRWTAGDGREERVGLGVDAYGSEKEEGLRRSVSVRSGRTVTSGNVSNYLSRSTGNLFKLGRSHSRRGENRTEGEPPSHAVTTLEKQREEGEGRKENDLATRLNVLSVAHADGLLGDDEYRLLKGELFKPFQNIGGSLLLDSPTKEINSSDGSRAQSISSSTYLVIPSVSHSTTTSARSSTTEQIASHVVPSRLIKKSASQRSTAATRSRISLLPLTPSHKSPSNLLSPNPGPTHSGPTSVRRTRSIRNYPELNPNAPSFNPHRSNVSEHSHLRSSTTGTSSYRSSTLSHHKSRSSLVPPSGPLPPIPSAVDPYIFINVPEERTNVDLREEIEDTALELDQLEASWRALEAGLEKELRGWRGLEGVQGIRARLEDVRRKREATRGKYELRLEYLRAQLRGAQIREGIRR